MPETMIRCPWCEGTGTITQAGGVRCAMCNGQGTIVDHGGTPDPPRPGFHWLEVVGIVTIVLALILWVVWRFRG